MSIETITAYRTDDGKVFTDQHEAEAYAYQGTHRASAEAFLDWLNAKTGKVATKGARSRAVNIITAFLAWDAMCLYGVEGAEPGDDHGQ